MASLPCLNVPSQPPFSLHFIKGGPQKNKGTQLSLAQTLNE